ncbi:MAG: flagellar brake protein [Sphingomonadaceae bacterium]
MGKARLASRLLPVGQLITIVPEAPEDLGRGRREGYPSRIEDVLEDAIVVSTPTKARSLVALNVDTRVSVHFNRGGVRYNFSAVVAALTDGRIPFLVLREVGEVRRDERRSHVRVDACMEPVDMVVDPELGNPPDKRSTLVVNISAGGLGMVCRRPLPIGSSVRLKVRLPDGFGRLVADAEAVRCTEMDLGGVKKWKIGVSFVELPEDQQDRVIRFVLHQQQLLRRRGLL